MLGLQGWYSTNILGNRDGEVLDDPGSFRTKEQTKLKNTLRWLMGEEQITHPGMEYYPDPRFQAAEEVVSPRQAR